MPSRALIFFLLSFLQAPISVLPRQGEITRGSKVVEGVGKLRSSKLGEVATWDRLLNWRRAGVPVSCRTDSERCSLPQPGPCPRTAWWMRRCGEL